MAKDFSPLERSRLVLVATQSPTQWVMETFFVEVKGEEQTGCEAGHSPMSDAWNNVHSQIYFIRYIMDILHK